MSVLKYKDADGNWVPVSGGGNIDVTAEVGQTIIVKEVDANGKPTAWESADYPLAPVEIIPSTTYAAGFDDSLGVYTSYIVTTKTLIEGGRYIVWFDGVKYICTAKPASLDGLTAVFIGNGAILGGNTGEPFALASVDKSIASMAGLDGIMLVFGFDGSEHTLRVEQIELASGYASSAYPLYIYATAEPSPNGGINYPVNYTFTTSADEVKKAFDDGREIKLSLQLHGERAPAIYNLATAIPITAEGAMMYLFTLPYSDYGNADAVVGLHVGYVRPILQILGVKGSALQYYSD